MKIPSRAWGFVRVGLQNSFGVLVADFGTGGAEDNPLLNDVDAGDEAAGVEFVPVFAAQEASGTLTVRTDGSLSFVGAVDGTYVIPYSLYTFTPGDSAAVDEGDTDVTVVVGASSSPPTLSLLTTTGITATTATLGLTLTGGSGTNTLYVVVGLSSGWSDPSASEIKLGQLAGGGAATYADTDDITSAGSGAYVVTPDASGLTAGASYKWAAVASDGTTDSAVVVSGTWTQAAGFQAAWARGANTVIICGAMA